MKATQAEMLGLELARGAGALVNLISPVDVEYEVRSVNVTDKCVHIFFEDGSDMFICNPSFSEGLKFRAQRR